MSSAASVLHRIASTVEMRPLVCDHVVRGRVVFPGAAYLEMARAMQCMTAPSPSPVRLALLLFLQPLVLDECACVECTLDGGSGELTVRSRASRGTADSAIHFSAVAASDAHSRQPAPSWLRSRVSHPTRGSSLYDMFWSVGLEYGPAHRTLDVAWASAGAAIGRLRGRREWQGTQLHPADLDGALQLPMAIAEASAGRAPPTLLPFAADAATVAVGRCRLWPVRVRCLGVR